jgi:hypothetical protein
MNFNDIIAYFRGSAQKAEPGSKGVDHGESYDVPHGGGPFTPAAPTDFPSKNDVAFARKAGFGYGTGVEGRRPGASWDKMPTLDTDAIAALVAQGDVRSRKTRDVADALTQAHLAANRSPLASLGFDPRAVGYYTSGDNFTLGGFYDPVTGSMWATSPDAIVHESIHRGLRRMLDEGLLPPDLKDFVANRDSPIFYELEGKRVLRSNEAAVRRTMDVLFNGVERGKGELGDKEIELAKEGYERTRTHWNEKLERLNDMAARIIARNRPGGPR